MPPTNANLISTHASIAPDGRTVFWFQKHSGKTPEDWEATRERKRKKLAKSMPLFADQVEQIVPIKTADQYAREDERYWRRLANSELRSYALGQCLRAIVGKLVSPDRMAELDAWRFRMFPADVTYTWGFWFARLKEIAPCLAHEVCLNRVRHHELARWHDHCPACGKPLTQGE